MPGSCWLSARHSSARKCARDPAIVQRLAPERVEVGAGVLLLPVSLDEIVSSETGLARKDGDDLVRALAAVERLDEGLNDADRSIVRADIAPRFR